MWEITTTINYKNGDKNWSLLLVVSVSFYSFSVFGVGCVCFVCSHSHSPPFTCSLSFSSSGCWSAIRTHLYPFSVGSWWHTLCVSVTCLELSLSIQCLSFGLARLPAWLKPEDLHPLILPGMTVHKPAESDLPAHQQSPSPVEYGAVTHSYLLLPCLHFGAGSDFYNVHLCEVKKKTKGKLELVCPAFLILR